MGVFVIDGGFSWKTTLTTGKKEFADAFLQACRDALPVAKRVNAKWATVVPGYFERTLPLGIQTGHVIDALKRGAEILEPHGTGDGARAAQRHTRTCSCGSRTRRT